MPVSLSVVVVLLSLACYASALTTVSLSQGTVFFPTVFYGASGVLGLVSTCPVGNCVKGTIVHNNETDIAGNQFIISVPAVASSCSFTFGSIGPFSPPAETVVTYVGTVYAGVAFQYPFTQGTFAYILNVQGHVWSILQMASDGSTPLVASGSI